MTWPGRRCDEVRLGFTLLTRLPMGRIGRELPLAAAFWSYPLVGAVVGGLMALVYAGSGWAGLSAAAAAVLAVAAGILLTGGLHEDGFGDTLDGFGGGKTREDKLRIMKDSRVGSYAVCGLVLALGFRVVLIAGLGTPDQALAVLVSVHAASRAILPALMLILPAATAGGLGDAATRNAGPAQVLAALALGLAVVPCAGLPVWPFVLTLSLCLVGSALLAWRHLRGITGDVLGFAQVATELALLAVSSAGP